MLSLADPFPDNAQRVETISCIVHAVAGDKPWASDVYLEVFLHLPTGVQ